MRGSNFDKWQSDLNEVLQLAFSNVQNFLNLKSNFNILTKHEEVIIQKLLKSSIDKSLHVALKGSDDSFSSILNALEGEFYGLLRSPMVHFSDEILKFYCREIKIEPEHRSEL
ncbi:hypothetical protein BY996DRAFT_6527194 [Phakopsora pachyrhizi]|nr:hypothetical protein BY996DRAFT_6527194 [Phakopsora pachyrhizi]